MSSALLEEPPTDRAASPLPWKQAWWAVTAIYWLGMFGGTHWPQAPHAPFGNADKVMHFFGYFGLAILFATARTLFRPLSAAAAFTAIALLTFYGAVDEWTQPLVGRDCELLDWVADTAGVLLAIGLFQLAALAWRRLNGRGDAR